MNLKNVLTVLKESNIRLGLDGEDQLKIRAAKGAMTADIKQLLVDNKADLINWIKAKNAESQQSAPIPARSGDEELVLSFAQQRLWFIDQLDPGNIAYNIPAAARIQGALDIRVLKQVLDEIIRRHEILRTTFSNDDGIARQIVHDAMTCPLQIADVKDQDNLEQALLQLAKEEATKPFDLAKGPLIRVKLIRLNPQAQSASDGDFLMILNLHHIITDGWSNGVLLQEVTSLYAAFTQGKESPLPELSIQYADFALWQRDSLPEATLAEKVKFWTDKLKDVPVLELPMDNQRPAERHGHGNQIELTINSALTQGLNALSKQQGATLFITLMAAFKTLLHRYSGQSDICVGTPVAGRNRPEIQPLIGFFVNTLALRTDLAGDPAFSELMARVQDEMLEATKHQDVPFENIVDSLGLSRDMSVTPVFQTILVLQNAPMDQSASVAGLSFSQVATDSKSSKVDLSFNVSEVSNAEGDALSISVEYDTDLFTRERIERLINHFQMLVGGIIANPDAALSTLPLMTEAEREQILKQWSGVKKLYPRNMSIATLFEQQVDKAPDALALDFPDQQLNYRNLDTRASQLAHCLKSHGINKGDKVAISLDRSVDMVVGLVAIMKLGAAYIPLDPNYPDERLAFMLEDTAAPLIITIADNAARLQNLGLTTLPQILLLDNDRDAIAAQSGEWRSDSENAQGEQLAYVMYTSGSTGQPKGVMIPQRAIIRLVRNTNYIETSADDGFGHISNVSFDAATLEFWGALLNGARMVGIDKDTLLDREAFKQVLIEKRVSTMFITVTLFNLYVSQDLAMFASVKNLLVGGEALDPNKIRQVIRHNPPTRVLNGYGPTENTTFTASYVIEELADNVRSVPLGYPLANSTIYILDQHDQPVPIGVPGEICSGGDGVGLGYLNRDDLNAEKFVADPFSDQADRLMYRTGDIGRWLPNGLVEMIGRVDDQVKIRGYRIELGEIENALGKITGVKESAVLVREDQPGNKYLAGYVVPESPQGEESMDELVLRIRSELRSEMPAFMQPTAIVLMQAFPLTSNGKLDRQALPEPQSSEMVSSEYVAPRTEEEESIAAIWTEVLGVDRVGILDDFFELGGHSLVATQAIARMNDTLGINLPLRMLFEATTIETFMQEVEKIRHLGGARLAPAITGERRTTMADAKLPLSYAQQRLWIIDQIQPGSVMYNIPLELHISGNLDAEVLGQVFKEIVQRHESLRTTFGLEGLEAYQLIHAGDDWHMENRTFDMSAGEEKVREHITAFMMTPFDLASGPLIKVQLLQLQNTVTNVEQPQFMLLMVMHHIISDGASMEVLLREVVQLYDAFSQSKPSPLAPLEVQYADYALWQHEWLSGEVLQQQLDYWKTQLTGVPLLELPMDRPRPPQISAAGKLFEFELDAQLSQRLRELSGQQGTTLFMTLLAAFQLLLARYSGQDDITVGSPIANRTQQAVEPLIGFFVNMLALRSEIDLDASFSELLSQVKNTTLDAYQYQDVSFDQLVDELNIPRDMSHSPIFQVMFVVQNADKVASIEQAMDLGDIQFTPLLEDDGSNDTAARFDITLTMTDGSGPIKSTLEYRTALFDDCTIEAMVKHFSGLLQSIVEQPNHAVGTMPLMGADQQRSVIEASWHDTRVEREPVAGIHTLFEQQVERTPDAIAVAYDGSEWSYKTLNEKANQLAHHLVSLGVGPDVMVGVGMERSLEMSLALMAVLKAGGAYVPFDPSFPAERLGFMAEDTQVPVMLTQSHLTDNLPTANATVLSLDSDAALWNGQASSNVGAASSAQNLFNVIFTSGSTGKPKGVMVPHEGIINRLLWMQETYPLGASDNVLQKTPYSFDVSVWELFWPLIVGARLEYAKPEGHKEPDYLRDLIKTKDISTLHFVPSMLGAFLQCDGIEQCQSIRQVFCSGEALQLGHERIFFERLGSELPEGAQASAPVNAELHNLYGPTEASVDVSYFACQPNSSYRSVPIGKAVANTQLHVLDKNLQPVPLGIVGELYIGGVQLARGYLNREELTRETFIDNPFHAAGHPSPRLYKTGDLARLLADGNIEYIGRVDFQVKVRGLRIELGEIETVLHQHEQIRDTIVVTKDLAKSGADSNVIIVAYIVPQDPEQLPDKEALRLHLKQQMPEYMVPNVFMPLNAIPLSPNGKANRKALPEPELGDLTSTPYVAPRNDMEETLVGLWAELLQIDKIGVEHNFFELGGHSLLAVKLITMVREQFDVEIPVSAVFEASTVAGMANYIETVLWTREEHNSDPSDADGDREEFEL